jgi:hypothetical protein
MSSTPQSSASDDAVLLTVGVGNTEKQMLAVYTHDRVAAPS